MSGVPTVLSKIARAIEEAADPFAIENARLAAAGTETQRNQSPHPGQEVAPGIRFDFRPDSGVVAQVGPGANDQGLRLKLKERGDSPWVSLSYGIDIEPLREARYLGHFLRCDSRGGGVRFRTCLRHLFEEGFHDVFAREVVVLTGAEPEEDLVFIRLDPALLARTKATEVLFFFEGRSFDVTLRDIEALRV